ncbi:hypothetical protein GA0111570_107122 [Raineyella antarctica]|uniref:Uncharacterized protein n=1 Tax=Raineyella antarctica TaxID=1577474 RepID=A0A1G6H8B8_9ACTN|nr:hypothetical protein GA0111570_107122 [Raineyella antarctica]
MADDPEPARRELRLCRAGKASRRLSRGVGNDMNFKDFPRHEEHTSPRR